MVLSLGPLAFLSEALPRFDRRSLYGDFEAASSI